MSRSAQDVAEQLGHFILKSINDTSLLKNGHLINTFISCKKKQKDTVDTFVTHVKSISGRAVDAEMIRRHLRKIAPAFESCKKGINNATQWANLISLLREPFPLSLLQVPTVSDLSPAPTLQTRSDPPANDATQSPPRKRPRQTSPKTLLTQGGAPKSYHVLIGCTGSVASIKLPSLVNSLMQSELKLEVKIISTDHAQHFFKRQELNVPFLTDKDEWENWSSVQDPVLHIELRRWADVMLIAPLDANTLAKMATGLCDNLLTCVVRAWDPKRPLLFAPAMNTFMWEHPITATHIATLKGFGYTEIPCISKKLACGDTGYGAMAEVPTLVAAVEQALKSLPASSAST